MTQRSFVGRALFPAFAAVALAGAPALAQVQLPGAVIPGRDRLPPAAPPEPELDFRIETPRRSPVPRAVDELRFPLRDVRIVGATIIPAEAFRPLYEPLLGQEVGLSDIVALAEQIEGRYREEGYLLTRAFVPPQRVGDGVFTINVVEGYVKAATVEGGSPEVRKKIEAYLVPVTMVRPLKTEVLERALLLANDLPGVAASGLLRPSADEPGASDLVVTVVEAPYTAALSADNRGSNFSGRWLLSADGAYNALPGGPHQLVGGFAMAPDLLPKVVGQLRYVRPIGNEGLQASFGGVFSYGEPTGSLHDQFDLQTSSLAFGPRVSYPLMKTRANSVLLDGGLTFQDARVDANTVGQLSGIESHDIWRVIDGSVSYINNGFLAGLSSVTLGIAQGIGILGASDSTKGDPTRGTPGIIDNHRSRPDGVPDFTKLTLNARRTQLIDGPITGFAALTAQWASTGLFAGEEIAFGGNQIGRGYDPGAITGDSGIGATLELRYDYRFPDHDLYAETAQFYTFYDGAGVSNRQSGQLSVPLHSVGVGVRLGFPADINVNLELADTLRAIPTSQNGHSGPRILVGTAVRF